MYLLISMTEVDWLVQGQAISAIDIIETTFLRHVKNDICWLSDFPSQKSLFYWVDTGVCLI